MRTSTSIALALVAGVGIGAAGIETLHAQAKPPVYTIAEVDTSNPEAYGKEYAPKAQALIRKHGGTVLAGSNNVVVLDGGPAAKRIAIHRWESMEKAKAWISSADVKENRKSVEKTTKFRILAVEGVAQK